MYRRYFLGTITRPQGDAPRFEFTLKYRTTGSAWKWVNDNSTLTNGELYFQSATIPQDLGSYFHSFTSSYNVESVKSDVPGTELWSLTHSVGGAGKESTFSENLLGVPLDVTRWFALVRIWSPWLSPRHGKTSFKTDEDAVVCSFLRRDGLHLVLLAISGMENMLTVFKDDGQGGVIVSARNDSADTSTARVLAATGRSHETALAACMYHARRIVSGWSNVSNEEKEVPKASEEGDVHANWLEEWYDGLTYCTWNGLGQNLTDKKIFDALDSLESNDIKITNLIIDDNWQSLDNPGAKQDRRGMTEFDANKEGFPRGLEKTVTDIRDKHPSIDHVAVWHAMLGYWGAISPTGAIAKKYKTKVVRRTNGEMTVIVGEDIQRFYDDFYDFLHRSRIDGVKTDAQFFLDLLVDPEDRRDLIPAYQDAWEISYLRYFKNRAISCMSQIPQIIFHSQLPTNKPRIMMRNSDDFFPEIPSSHPWHIFTNAFAALLNQHLNILPDWDMFQTYHEYSSFHGAARCVSGGPIYFTDEPGKHGIDLIKQMTAQSNKGKTVILRPSTVGKVISTGLYTAYEEQRLLKIGTYHGHADTGSGILGVFNVSQAPLSELVMLREFAGVEEEQDYVVRAHTTGEITEPLRLTDALPLVSLFLEPKSWEILTAYPLLAIENPAATSTSSNVTNIALLGLLGKMSGAAAILSSTIEEHPSKRMRISATMKALGVIGRSFQAIPILFRIVLLVLGCS